MEFFIAADKAGLVSSMTNGSEVVARKNGEVYGISPEMKTGSSPPAEAGTRVTPGGMVGGGAWVSSRAVAPAGGGVAVDRRGSARCGRLKRRWPDQQKFKKGVFEHHS